jgi:hypothetical protein
VAYRTVRPDAGDLKSDRTRKSSLCGPPAKRRAHVPLNDRQRAILNRLFNGFEGQLTSSKWAKITNCSQDTAIRDIHGLAEKGILVRNAAGGRSTSYSLAEIKRGTCPESIDETKKSCVVISHAKSPFFKWQNEKMSDLI